MITERYRKDYTGEFIILNTAWAGGKKRTQREWMPNPIENHHISGRAACIGSSVDKLEFDFTILQRHKGGLLGSKKLQTYGVGEIAKQMRLDFAVGRAGVLVARSPRGDICRWFVVGIYHCRHGGLWRSCAKYPRFASFRGGGGLAWTGRSIAGHSIDRGLVCAKRRT